MEKEVQPSVRFVALDAVRGVAAFAVGMSHHLLALDGRGHPLIARVNVALKWSPLYPFVAGYESVVLFFVLSGFVLTLPQTTRRADGYPVFAVRRILRLYPPYVAAVLIAVAGQYLYHSPPADLGAWVSTRWKVPISHGDIANYMLMVHHFDPGPLNPVLWSLIVEMRISLLFPLIAWIGTRPSLGAGVVAISFCTMTRVLGGHLFHGSLATDLLDTIEFGGMFIAGAMLANRHRELCAWIQRLSRLQVALFFGAAWTCYAYGRGLTHILAPLGDVPITVGACSFITLVIARAGRSHSWLTTRPAAWLGRVSYSYYLIHVVVLLATIHIFDRVIPAWAAVIISIPLGFVVARLLYGAFEAPSIALGRKLSASMRAALRPSSGSAP